MPKNKKLILSQGEWSLSLNERIALVAFRLVQDYTLVPNVPIEPMYCLKFARRVVETAMGIRDRGFYDLVVGEDSNPTANELELLFKKQRSAWRVTSDYRPGDIAFWYDQPKGWGHVAPLSQYWGTLWVAQNTTLTKGRSFGQKHLRLVKLTDMGTPTSVFRINK